MKRDYTFEIVVGGILALVAGLFIYDSWFTTKIEVSPRSGCVSARIYVAAHTEVHTTFDSKGNAEVHTHYVSDQYRIVVRLDCGIVHTYDTTLQEWSRWHEKDRVYLSWKETGLLHIAYGETLAEEGKVE